MSCCCRLAGRASFPLGLRRLLTLCLNELSDVCECERERESVCVCVCGVVCVSYRTVVLRGRARRIAREWERNAESPPRPPAPLYDFFRSHQENTTEERFTVITSLPHTLAHRQSCILTRSLGTRGRNMPTKTRPRIPAFCTRPFNHACFLHPSLSERPCAARGLWFSQGSAHHSEAFRPLFRGQQVGHALAPRHLLGVGRVELPEACGR